MLAIFMLVQVTHSGVYMYRYGDLTIEIVFEDAVRMIASFTIFILSVKLIRRLSGIMYR